MTKHTFSQAMLDKTHKLLKKIKKAHPKDDRVWSRLPVHAETWNLTEAHSGHKANKSTAYFAETLQKAQQHRAWSWPKRPIFFIADPHADADAFTVSLVATGGVKLTDKQSKSFELTRTGRKSVFIIGGDCLDKGPSNLDLLDVIKQLLDTGARVKILAGNHDMRLYMGIHAMGLERHPATEHMFVRMGDKVIPLLTEIHRRYLDGKPLDASIPSKEQCREILFPRESWFENFPEHAVSLMTPAGIKRELHKMRRKYEHFEQACSKAGFDMREVYAIAQQCRKIFLEPNGDYAWFFGKMQLAYRRGSFLFLHAGLDDAITEAIENQGVRRLNKQFRREMEQDLFTFYYGSLANTMRTKYRDSDLPLSHAGVKRINRQGIHALVQGHINRKFGQRLVLKQGLLHIESDITLDRHSRSKEGLRDYGVGVTMILPEGKVIGLSADYGYAKVFHPNFYQ